MDGMYVKESYLCKQRKFTEEFRIERFEESKYPETKDFFFDNDDRNIGVSVTIFGKGWFENISDYVMLYTKNFVNMNSKTILFFSCTFYTLDANRERKIPRAFHFRFLVWRHETYSETYVKRKLLLSNATECLPCGDLTIIAEGTLEEWYVTNHYFLELWGSKWHVDTFQFQENEEGLRVYLPKDSVHAQSVTENSSVFREMWNMPMREMHEKRVLLNFAEIPAFLCMLIFIETNSLVLHRIKIFDLYKIAHMYDIPILLKKCIEYIEKIPLKTVTDILDFATHYEDENMKELVSEKYSWKGSQNTSDSKIRKDLKDYVVCDTDPSSKGVEDAKTYITNLCGEFFEINSVQEDAYVKLADMAENDFVIAPGTSENNTSNSRKNWFGNFFEKFLKILSIQDDSATGFTIDSHSFEPWLKGKISLRGTTVFDLYKVAYKCGIPFLLQECRRYIQRIPLKTVSDILEFATYYEDEDLIRTAKLYLEKVRDLDPNFQTGNDLEGYSVCDVCPVSNDLIFSKEDFKNYLFDIWIKGGNTEMITGKDLDHIHISEFKCSQESFDFYR